jgi:4-amino-4-deoxy-L-arabinose transferase-like glycosyltransferase
MSPLGIRASKVRSWRSSLLQSVWYDEALSLTRSRLPLAEMMAKVSQDFVHPPLHNFLLYVWYKIVGFGAWQSRLLSVIFHTLAIVIMYQLAQYLFEHAWHCCRRCS